MLNISLKKTLMLNFLEPCQLRERGATASVQSRGLLPRRGQETPSSRLLAAIRLGMEGCGRQPFRRADGPAGPGKETFAV